MSQPKGRMLSDGLRKHDDVCVSPAKLKPDIMKILAASSDISSNISKIRLKIPLEAVCKEAGWGLSLKSIHEISLRDIDWCDIFILQRCTNSKSLKLCRRIKSCNKFFIFEIDDLLPKVPSFLMLGKLKPPLEFASVVELCDIVSTTNNRLGLKITEGKKRFFISENYRFPYFFQKAKHDEMSNIKASIIIAASDSILIDFIIPSLFLLLKEYGDGIKIITIGHTSKAVNSAGIISISHPILPHSDFMSLVSRLENPIGLLPLDDSEFSSCKSPIKYFDYSSIGVPSVASDHPPYNEVIDNGVTGFLVKNTAQDWFEKVQALIENVALRQQIGFAAMEHVNKNHSLEKNTQQWKQALLSVVLNDRPQGSRHFRFLAYAADDLVRFLRTLNRKRLALWHWWQKIFIKHADY
ncbi:MAG: glycosyltransferase [Burkholderiales bacterium]